MIADFHVIFFDEQNGLIEMDSSGHYVRNIGQLGKERGSYMRVAAIEGDATGGVTIWDPVMGRFTTFRNGKEPLSAWIRDGGVQSVLVTADHPVALTVLPGDTVGERVQAAIAPVNTRGLLDEPLVTVLALASRSKKNADMIAIPNFYWRYPIWTRGADGSFWYIPPDSALRIEVYDKVGRPKLLITGQLPFPKTRVLEEDIRRREAALYDSVFHQPFDRQRKNCGLLPTEPSAPQMPIDSMKCMMVKYLENTGKRSPTFFPSVSQIISFPSGELWLRTSVSAADSTTWVVVDADGDLMAQANLPSSAHPIGRAGRRIAFVESAALRTQVYWRETLKQ